MPEAERLLNKVNKWPISESSRATVKFGRQSFSQEIYHPIYQEAGKRFIYFIALRLKYETRALYYKKDKTDRDGHCIVAGKYIKLTSLLDFIELWITTSKTQNCDVLFLFFLVEKIGRRFSSENCLSILYHVKCTDERARKLIDGLIILRLWCCVGGN